MAIINLADDAPFKSIRSAFPVSYLAMYKAVKFSFPHFAQFMPIYDMPYDVFFRDCGALITLHFSMVYGADLELEDAQQGIIARDGVSAWDRRKEEYLDMIKEMGLYDPYVGEELNNTSIYWQLEDEMFLDGIISAESLVRMLDVIPGDIVSCHYLCHRMLGLPIDMNRIMAIRSLECVEELESQAIQYPDDMRTNSFNIYRMFVRLYGEDAPRYYDEERRKREAILYDWVSKMPAEEQPIFTEIIESRGRFNGIYYFLDKPTIPATPDPILES